MRKQAGDSVEIVALLHCDYFECIVLSVTSARTSVLAAIRRNSTGNRFRNLRVGSNAHPYSQQIFLGTIKQEMNMNHFW